MNVLIGYARCSTDQQDLTVQRQALEALGVESGRIYSDHGLTGTNRDRPGLRDALAACREGDTLVVTKLDRLARSVPDARDIVDELTKRGVKLQLAGSVHDPNDPIGKLLFNVLAMVAEFESDLTHSCRAFGSCSNSTRKRSCSSQSIASTIASCCSIGVSRSDMSLANISGFG